MSWTVVVPETKCVLLSATVVDPGTGWVVFSATGVDPGTEWVGLSLPGLVYMGSDGEVVLELTGRDVEVCL